MAFFNAILVILYTTMVVMSSVVMLITGIFIIHLCYHRIRETLMSVNDEIQIT